MKNLERVIFNVKLICHSAYKGLFLLKYLLVKPLSKEEIFEVFKSDDLAPQDISTENIRVILNTLKGFGCKISKPLSKNDNKYELLEHPFCIKLNKKEIKLINKFRKNPACKNTLDYALGLNSFVNTMCLMIQDNETKEALQNRNLLPEINISLINRLKQCCENKSTVLLTYLSGKKLSELKMETSFLKYEKDRLYVWGYIYKYNEIAYLRADKIKDIKIISNTQKPKEDLGTIRFKVFYPNYIVNEEVEKIVEEKENEITIDYKIENKFKAIQKFLEMGDNCKIISPESFKKEFIQIVKKIKEGYKNG